MFTKVKSADEIKSMRTSGQILGHVLKVLKQEISAGMSTKDLAEIAKRELKATGGQPTFLGYQGFPDVLCVSVNDEVVHGIPRTTKIINSGDIVSMDFGVTYQNMITDAATTVIVDKALEKSHVALVENTARSLQSGISVVHDHVRVGEIGTAIEKILNGLGYGIVRDLVGHGVGHDLHEDPNIPNYSLRDMGPELVRGMTIAIEPMATLGDYRVSMDNDGWTVRTADGSMAAHFEHTVLITKNGAEILTKNR